MAYTNTEKDADLKQIELFPIHRQSFANLIDVVDVAPFFAAGAKGKTKYHLSLDAKDSERTFYFTHKGQELKLSIKPALIKKKLYGKDRNKYGGKKEVNLFTYPSVNEELVYYTLMFLAADKHRIKYKDDQILVRYSLYEIARILKENGKTKSIDEIREALEVLQATSFEIETVRNIPDAKVVYSGRQNMVSSLYTKDVYYEDGSSSNQSIAVLNDITRTKILNGEYRRYNSLASMRFRYQLTRYLHRRMSMNFIQASTTASTPYSIKASTLIKDSGATWSERVDNNKRTIENAIKELIKHDYIKHYTIEPIKQRKTVDYKVNIWAGVTFVEEKIFANTDTKKRDPENRNRELAF